MQLPFCKICGMHHRLGGCPLFQEPPALRKPIRKEPPVAVRPQTLRPVTGEPDEKPAPDHRQAIEEIEKQKPAIAAQHQDRGAVALVEAGRAYTPDDMKQESLPARQFFERARFDKRKYMRELMRVRRANAKAGAEVAKNTPTLQ